MEPEIHQSAPLDTVLSNMKATVTLTSCSFAIHFNIILATPRSSNWSLSFRFSDFIQLSKILSLDEWEMWWVLLPLLRDSLGRNCDSSFQVSKPICVTDSHSRLKCHIPFHTGKKVECTILKERTRLILTACVSCLSVL
jgi:hypothetical protein